ncbi:pantothenate synthetase [Trifolium pratense]|uniref:Pantothenate synthetase n=1 Tax=Trifolium pratense TaxID=57577 RepID=A0A2K3PCF1_TRIPR|nr:pantothenate synthetase [Trifolium pratense]
MIWETPVSGPVRWVGVIMIMPPNFFKLFAWLNDEAKNKKVRKGFRLVWHTMLWVMWKSRNNHIFHNVLKNPIEIVDEIKMLTWKWSVEKLKIILCHFYEWIWDPVNALGISAVLCNRCGVVLVFEWLFVVVGLL